MLYYIDIETDDASIKDTEGKIFIALEDASREAMSCLLEIMSGSELKYTSNQISASVSDENGTIVSKATLTLTRETLI